jgi:outer membrane receptor protein involved in Fe transport
VCLLPAAAGAQAIYGGVTGSVADGSGAAVPGATVTIVNKDTNLELTAVTDETGTYTIRNVPGGTYTLKASLQGFKEFVQTEIPITAGGIVRINGRLEIGALTESVTVTTEAALLKTDKADVSVDLRPEEVTNLPLNQYRNYQTLLNLVPGATPTYFQNAQTDTPGRALSTNINGTNRNNNVTRIDGAASINVWLPHHVGYVAPAETIENVNVSTNSFDAAQGMTGGAATTVQTKSGTNNLRGSAFFFRQQDELNARRGYFDPTKLDSSVAIMGGTVGGPIVRNKFFYFGSWERNNEKNSRFDTYTVPTMRMRQGDFSEVVAFNPAFRIYDPTTGDANGNNRTAFSNAIIPAERISSIARTIQALYPEPNNVGTQGGLQNNLFLPRNPEAMRDNYDGKLNWNRNSSHQIWGKFSMMDASVMDLFYLPIEGVGGGDTRVTLWTVGQTWTLSPTLIFDANGGSNKMTHQSSGPDYGTNFGLETFGIPGLNSAGVTGPGSTDLERYSGMPVIDFDTFSDLGNNAGWTPVWRKEISYTASANLTKVQGRHELRTGVDFVRLTLDHWQPEVANPRGTLAFGGNITGQTGYTTVGGWNSYAAFLLGQMSGFSKSVQFEEMTGRENQFGLYVSDRWQVNENLTLNLGLRYEYYPLMSRADRGLEQLDYETFLIRLGGLGGNPKDLGVEVDKKLFAPRVGLAYRINEDTVFRTGFGRTFNPLPWSRPMRGFYPATIAYSAAGPNGFTPYATLAQGIPGAPNPDIASGTIPLPRGVAMRSPDPDDVKRGHTDSWNMFIERRLPMDISASIGYVGTRTDGGYADINLNTADSGGNANRRFFAQAGNADILDWAARTRSRYHALQTSINRPFKGGFLLKGAYTFSKTLNEADEDGWTGPLTWNQPSQQHRNYARAGFDRPHVLQMAFVWEMPFARERSDVLGHLVKNWQISGVGSWMSGRPFTINGDNAVLQQQGGTQTINVTGEAKPGFGDAGPDDPWYDPSIFSQPGNAWGNSGRNAFRGPSNWNIDASLFRVIPFGQRHLELRVESMNVLNHPQWGNPVNTATDPNFLRIRAFDANGGRPPRTVQLGIRFAF